MFRLSSLFYFRLFYLEKHTFSHTFPDHGLSAYTFQYSSSLDLILEIWPKLSKSAETPDPKVSWQVMSGVERVRPNFWG